MNLLLGSVGVFWALQLIFAYQVVRKEKANQMLSASQLRSSENPPGMPFYCSNLSR